YCQRAKASFAKEPLSAEAEARLEAIRDRNMPRPDHATLPTAPAPRALASAVRAASPTSATTPPPSGLASKVEAPTTATSMAAASASAKPASRGMAAAASGVVTDPAAAAAAAAAAATASASSGKSGGEAGGRGSGDVGRPPDTTQEAWYGFGGRPLEQNFLRVKCNFCQTPVGDLPKAKSGAAGSGGRQGGRPGEWDSPRPTSINAPPPPPLISYCSSCRN
ncbi:unnamed protein product, partial [Ectocarpus sp. 8 AP-2014]